MPQFAPGTQIETEEPVIEVTVDAENPIPTGPHRFQLEVVDDSGNVSDPFVLNVVIKDTERPTAVIVGPDQVEFGQAFRLDGRKSSDVPPGSIKSYRWMLLD